MAPVLKEYIDFLADGSLDALRSHTWAWKVVDYTALRRRTRVGESRAIPGADGGSASPPRIFVPREWDEHTVVLTWKINGLWTPDGVRYEIDPVDAVDLNHQIILDNVVNALGLRAVRFKDRHDVQFDGDIVIDNWEPVTDPNAPDRLISPMTLKIPAGWLEAA